MKDFDQYIQTILKKSKLTSVEQGEMYLELYDHLLSLKAEYIEKGLTEEEAVEAAIKDFGEAEQLGAEMHKSKHPFQKYISLMIWILFIPYAAGMIWLFLIYDRLGVMIPNLPYTIQRIQEIGILTYLKTNFNIVPFKTIMMYLINFNHYNLDTWLLNTVANVVLFIPFGFFVPILFTKVFNFKKAIQVFATTVFLIEMIQFVSLSGVFDIDDIILNVTGSCIGYAIWHLGRTLYLNGKNRNPIKTT